MPPESKKPKKPGLLDELRKLNVKYGIHFKGPKPPSTWSRDYQLYNGLFLDIRRISRTHFDEYSESARGEPLAVAEQKLKVQEIIDAAYQCRSERLNEEGWIRAIEPGLVSRLGTEVVW